MILNEFLTYVRTGQALDTPDIHRPAALPSA